MKQPEYEIRLLQVAGDDLREIINYIALDNPVAAITLLDKIENSLSGLISFPLPGKIPAEEALAGMGYRFLAVSNYLVFYTVEEKIIWVHRIIHGVRNYINLL
ncbi:MAG: type II toxin-antitoxin system RelE/ParE family toxin [Smithella sp.]|jgi:plasmid stabilization system protein ParE